MEEGRIIREELEEKRPPLYVYRAKHGEKHLYLNEIIPYITTNKEAISQFLNLINDFSQQEYKDIARIIEIKKKGIRILVLEEIIEGKNLEFLVNQNRPIKSPNAIMLIYNIARAFQKFHEKGIFGLGIEPKNIIVHDTNNITIVHPVFSIAEKFFRKTDRPEILNPRYLSPEQIKHNSFSEKGDLFTIGILLFEMLNNIYPYSGYNYKLLDFRKSIPYGLKYVTERLLRYNPEERFNSFHTFIEELHVCKEKYLDKKVTEKPEVKESKREEIKEKKKPVMRPKRVEKVEAKKKKKKEPAAISQPQKKKLPRKARKKLALPIKPLLIAGIAILGLIVFATLIPKIIRIIRPCKVASLSVNKNVVKAKSGEGKTLWHFKTGSDITFFKMVNIDNDNRMETILGTGFLLTNEKDEKRKGKDNAKFYVLSENGKIIFSEEIGDRSLYPEGSSRWIIYDIHMLDINDDGLIDFIPLAITDDSLDCILFTKIQKGATTRFWHAGKITVINLSRDTSGETTLICAGKNARMGDKPVLFALRTTDCNDQSPPWGGNEKEMIGGLLWYRFLSGGFSIKNIIEEEPLILVAETAQGKRKTYRSDGFEILKEDSTDDMITARGESYLEGYREMQKAMSFYKEGDIASALITLNPELIIVSEDQPLISAIHYLKGLLFIEQRKWKSATASFSLAVKSDTQYYGAFFKLGEVYSEREQFNNAATAFNKAYRQSGNEIHYYRMIDSYTAMGKYKKARNLLKKFEKNAADKIRFLFELANIAREEGAFPIAIHSYETISDREPKMLLSYILLSDVYAEINKNIIKADSLFAFASKKDSSFSYENAETAAWLLYRKSRFQEALEKINIAAEREEKRKESSVVARRKLPRIYYRKAIICQPIGKKDEKNQAIASARSSRFNLGYIKKQLTYLIESQ